MIDTTDIVRCEAQFQSGLQRERLTFAVAELAKGEEPASLLDKLRARFSYDPDTGIFTHLSGVRRGLKAGYAVQNHICLKFEKIARPAHRMAWLYYYGDLPKQLIDHINRDGRDNRIANLREATFLGNSQNSGLRRDNTSGFKGVSLCAKTHKWVSEIKVNRVRRWAGFFETAELAARAYDVAAIAEHGEFACTNVMLGLLPPLEEVRAAA